MTPLVGCEQTDQKSEIKQDPQTLIKQDPQSRRESLFKKSRTAQEIKNTHKP